MVLIVESDKVGEFLNEPVFFIFNRLPMFVFVLFFTVAKFVECFNAVIGPDNLSSSDQELSNVLLNPTMTPLHTLNLRYVHSLESVY